MSTGTAGGAYDEVARRYKAILARSHVDLRLVESAGAVENLRRLCDPQSDVSVGFVQNGLTTESESPDLVSLGTVSYEPLWLFYRGAAPGLHWEGLRGRKVSIGPEGSGSRALALELLSRNAIGPGDAQLLPLPLAESGEQLLAGKIDATFLVASWDAPIVRRLLADSRVELANFARANAYVMLDPFLDQLTLPAGVGRLASDRPPADVTLVAPKSSLIVRGDLHPAIQYLLLDAASQVHSGAGVFNKSGQFPSSLRGRGLQQIGTISGRGAVRRAALARGPHVLQIGAAVPAAVFAVLVGRARRAVVDPRHSDRRRRLSAAEAGAGCLQLEHAATNLSALR
jgi:TRAP-type uncharacterized transport system substrate-binding protein